MAEAIDRAAESSLAKWVNRLIVPLLIALCAYFGSRALTEIQAKQDRTDANVAQIAASAQSVQIDVRLLGARLDYSVVAQIAALDRRVEKNEAELRALSTQQARK